jgi:hypothetical protein
MFKLIFIYIYTYAVNHKGTSINSSRAGTQDIRGFYPHVTAPVHRAMTAIFGSCFMVSMGIAEGSLSIATCIEYNLIT